MNKAELHKKKEQEATVEKRIIFEGKRIDLFLEKIMFSPTKIQTFEIVHHPQAVLLLPLDSSKKIFFVKQYRRAVDKILLELPAGIIEQNEPVPEAAQRELQEEIGYKAGSLISLGGVYTSPGFCNEIIHLFLAIDLQKSSLPPDEDEHIDVVQFSLEETLDLIDKGQIFDAKTIVAILKYQRWLKK